MQKCGPKTIIGNIGHWDCDSMDPPRTCSSLQFQSNLPVRWKEDPLCVPMLTERKHMLAIGARARIQIATLVEYVSTGLVLVNSAAPRMKESASVAAGQLSSFSLLKARADFPRIEIRIDHPTHGYCLSIS